MIVGGITCVMAFHEKAGRSRRAPAFADADHNRRVYAGDAGRRSGYRECDQRGTQRKNRERSKEDGDFATKCYQTGRGGACKLLKIWWTWPGSNRRPLPCHGSALPAAPQAHSCGKADARKAGTSSIFSYPLGLVKLAHCVLTIHRIRMQFDWPGQYSESLWVK